MTRPETILINARLVTMDPLIPYASALAIVAGRVAALGSDADIRALAGPGTQVIDAGGRMVLPGFQDTHIHLQDSGQDYAQNADLSGARTVEELVETLAGFAGTHDRPWVNGTGWYSGVFGAQNLNAGVLDRAVPDRPCMIVASDGHNACLNSLGLKAVGFDRGTPDPRNGTIVRDASGAATGLLYESAVSLAEGRMPAPSDRDFADGVLWAMRLANRHGITGVIDAKVMERHVRVYQDLARGDDMTLRVASTALVLPEDTTAGALERLSDFRAESRHGLFRVHSAKFFLDGVIENRTAAMIEPYSDAQGGNAPLMFEPALIDEMFTAFDAARFQIHVHAIGDLASRAALDGMRGGASGERHLARLAPDRACPVPAPRRHSALPAVGCHGERPAPLGAARGLGGRNGGPRRGAGARALDLCLPVAAGRGHQPCAVVRLGREHPEPIRDHRDRRHPATAETRGAGSGLPS